MVRPILSSFLFLAILQSAFGKSIEVSVRAWINPPTIRVVEDRTVVLFFFATFRDRENRRWIEKLNRIDDKEDMTVIGLSAESEKKVRKFVKTNNVRFAVGSGSQTYRHLRIKSFPSVTFLNPESSEDRPSSRITDFEELESYVLEDNNSLSIDSETFDENSTLDVLKLHARHDPRMHEYGRALSLLRTRLPLEEFLSFCDEGLQDETDPFRRGSLHYERQLADPSVIEKEEPFATSALARRASMEDPDNPIWLPVRSYLSSIDTRNADELFSDFLDHPADDYTDALIRSSIPLTLASLEDKPSARAHLMEMMRLEKDSRVRQTIVVALGNICAPGDAEAIELLEQELQGEGNYRYVRPVIEYTIEYLQTGAE